MPKTLNQMILGHLIEIKAEKEPDKEVITFDNDRYPAETLDYKTLYEGSNKLSRALLDAGLTKGDKFGAMMCNHPELVYCMIAASTTGTVLVPLDPRTKGEKLAFQLNNSESKALVITSDLMEQFDSAKDSVEGLKVVLSLDKEGLDSSGSGGCQSLNEILEAPLKNRVENMVEAPNEPFQIIYTSGTTGDPKGVLCENLRFFLYTNLGRMIFGYKNDDVLYTGLSLTHGNAQAVTLSPSLGMGIKSVFSRKFTKSRLWDITRKYGVTAFSLLGGMMSGIYNEPEKPNDADNPVRMVCSAGTPRAIWESFEKRFDLKILEWYAAVEGGIAFKPIGQGPVGSFGKPPPGILDIKVVDEDDNECPPGVSGELISRPPGGAEFKVEYYKNKKASDSKTRGGWLRSGDMVHKDEDGWLFFDYRKGGGLRHNGDFVSPDFVEKVVGEHPDVSEVAVYGVPAKSGAPGEVDVVAAVKLFPGKDRDPASIFASCKEGLESNFVPSYIQFLDEIPKTISEKPQERFMTEKFDKEPENVCKVEDY